MKNNINMNFILFLFFGNMYEKVYPNMKKMVS